MEDDIVMDGVVLYKGKKLRQPKLHDEALPKIFKDSSYTKTNETKRLPPMARSDAPQTKKKKINTNEQDEQQNDEQWNDEQKLKQHEVDDAKDSTYSITDSEPSPKIPDIKLPGNGWGVHTYDRVKFYAKLSEKGELTHIVEVRDDELTAKIRGCVYPLDTVDLQKTINFIDSLKVCDGNGHSSYSPKCRGGVKKGLRCGACRGLVKNENKKKERAEKLKMRQNLNRKRSKKLHYLKKQNEGYKKREKSFRVELKKMCKINAKLEKNQVEEKIKTLLPAQQQAVIACLDAAKREGPQGNRFHVEWVYECLLMRIKSPSLYKHIRNHNIIVLPSRASLNRCMRKLKPVYGFQSVLFKVLKHKTSAWPETDVHGSILIDEIKIPSELSFDRHTYKMIGMVDIGNHAPEEDVSKAGDHALVLLFRPYRGDWIQALGAFLSKGNVKGPILAKLILEAIGLVEGAGLKVDAVATDGAKWNRVMWGEFNIDENNCSCEHPQDKERRLFFFSDWSHLIKCARNCWSPELPQKPTATTKNTRKKNEPRNRLNQKSKEISPQEFYEQKMHAALNKEVEVPEGTIKRQHWIALLREEEDLANRQGVAALTYVPGLSKKIVFPDGFERMNVAMARKFFSNSVRAGMEYYRRNVAIHDLQDSEPTEIFISKFNELCDALNSHGPIDAVRADNGKLEIISDYLKYHIECVQLAKKRGKAFFSKETDIGIIVTLKSTIELSEYLLQTVGFKYVMTARFNSDPIEQFFSKIRAAGKANSHPNPKMFAQLYRLLCVYSLIKPPQGSNCEGGDNVKILLNVEDSLGALEKERKEAIDALLDEIVGQGEVLTECHPMAHMQDHSYLLSPQQCEENLISFMSGFTSFKRKKLANNCSDCLQTFSKPRQEAGPSFTFLNIKEIYMGYTYPSDEMRRLITAVEKAVRESLENHGIKTNIFEKTLKYIRLDPASDHVGCILHKEDITKKVITFYLTMRMFFATDRRNKEIEMERRKQESKKLIKRARLL